MNKLEVQQRVLQNGKPLNLDKFSRWYGLFCELCGVIVDGTEPGYPQKCSNCD